jgi:hypothetical protein
MNVTIWLIYLFVGVVLFWRKSDDRVALLASLSLSLVLFPTQLNTPVLGPIAWIVPTEGVQFLGTLCLGLFLCVFPNGQFVPRWTSFLMIGWTVWWAIAVFFPTVPPRFPLFALPGFALAASLIASQVYRYRRVSTPVQRQQTKWAIFGSSYPLAVTRLISPCSTSY